MNRIVAIRRRRIFVVVCFVFVRQRERHFGNYKESAILEMSARV